MEAISIAWLCGFKSAANKLEFRFDFCFKMDAIFATIGPRSGHDRGLGPSSIACRSTGDECLTIPRQNLLDRGSIAPRSRFDRDAIVEFFHDVPPPLD